MFANCIPKITVFVSVVLIEERSIETVPDVPSDKLFHELLLSHFSPYVANAITPAVPSAV